jgi:hypothetical protein
MSLRLSLATLSIFVLYAVRNASAAPAGGKSLAPVPSAMERGKAEKVVREVFKEDFARQGPESRKSLAAKLLAEASQGDDLAAQYVLFQDSSELAASAGDLNGALHAVDAMALIFAVDSIDLKSRALTVASHWATKRADAAALAHASVSLADEAVAANHYDTAAKVAAEAETAAKTAEDAALLREAHAKVEEIQIYVRLAQGVKLAEEELKRHPDDPDANLAVGKFLCFVKGDWDGGAPHLSRGADRDLAAAAKLDLARPSEPNAQLAVGNAWWDLSQDPKPGLKATARRAATWYRKALPALSGLQRLSTEKRLSEVPRSTRVVQMSVFKFVNSDFKSRLIPLADNCPDVLTLAQQPMQFRLSGIKTFDWAMVNGAPGHYFGKAVFLAGADGGGSMHVEVATSADHTVYYLIMTDQRDALHMVKLPLQPNVSYSWKVSENEGTVRFEVTEDGKEVGSLNLPTPDFKAFGFVASVRHVDDKADITVTVE